MFLNARPHSEEYFSCKILHSFKSFVDFFECRRGTAVQLPRANQKPIHVARFVTSSNKTERGRPLQSPPPFLRFAKAIVGNAAVVTASAYGWITLYPNGSPLPTVANLNYVAGQTIPNTFNVGLGSDGAFKIYSYAQTDFVVDVAGYYSESAAPDANGVAGLLFYPLASPAHLLDTRSWATACFTPKTPLAGTLPRGATALKHCTTAEGKVGGVLILRRLFL